MFINISNHPSAKWSVEQTTAALELGGGIRDISFPPILPTASTERVALLADSFLHLHGSVTQSDVAMVQGEYNFTYSLVRRLRQRGVRVVVACTDRKAVESRKPDGTVEKTAVFQFAGFRDYE